jgi:hypothetical protein
MRIDPPVHEEVIPVLIYGVEIRNTKNHDGIETTIWVRNRDGRLCLIGTIDPESAVVFRTDARMIAASMNASSDDI